MQKVSTLAGIIIIVIVAVVLFGALFAYQYFTKSQISTSNIQPNSNTQTAGPALSDVEGWKTYTNNQYGYSIEYPSDWIFSEYPDTKTGARFRPINEQSLDTNKYPNGYWPINVDMMSCSSDCNTLFSDYVKTVAIQNIQNFEKLNSIESITTSTGIKGYKTSWIVAALSDENKKGVSGLMTYFENKKAIQAQYGTLNYKTVVVDGPSQGSIEYDSYVKIYNQMLSTFKLINATDQTADWKTYTNTQYGFEFQYPASLEIKQPTTKSTCEIGNGTEPSCEIIPFYYMVGEIIDHKFNEEIVWTRDSIQKYNSGDGESKIITIDGKNAYEYSFVTGLNYKVHGVQIPLDNSHFLQIEENNKMPVLTSSDWQHIISTFKFTK